MHTDFGRQLYGVSCDTVVQLVWGLSEQCVKKQCGLAVINNFIMLKGIFNVYFLVFTIYQ